MLFHINCGSICPPPPLPTIQKVILDENIIRLFALFAQFTLFTLLPHCLHCFKTFGANGYYAYTENMVI